jgi:flagellar M-ring protein FliF
MATGTQLQKSAPTIHGQPQFTDRLAGLWGRTRVGWAQMHPAQRAWTVVLILLLAGLVGGLFWYGMRPDWRILYADLDPEDVRQAGQVLAQAQIPFEPAPNGSGRATGQGAAGDRGQRLEERAAGL